MPIPPGETPLCPTGKMPVPLQLRQRDCLKGADDVVGAFGGEEALVISRAEVPGRALVIFVAIKSPDAAEHDETTDSVVPEIADIMKTKVGTRICPAEPGMIVKHDLREADDFFGWLHLPGGTGVITQRAECPFRVDNAAVGRRQFSFRYLFHRRVRRFFLFDQMKSGLSSREIVLLLRRSATVAQIFLQKCDFHRGAATVKSNARDYRSEAGSFCFANRGRRG